GEGRSPDCSSPGVSGGSDPRKREASGSKMDAAHPSRHGLPEAESVRTDPSEQSRPHAAGALPQVRRDGGGGARGTLGKSGHRHVPPDGSRRRRRVHPPRLPPLRHSPSRRRRAVAIRQMKNVLWSRTTWIAARGVVAAMRPGRAVGLCLIAVVLVQAGFFAGAPSDSSGNRFVLNRGVRLVTYDLSTMFATGSDFLSDPRIEYDGLSGRWFVTIGDFTTGQVLVAASRSTDPTLGWSIDRVPSSATSECMDQPILGVGT